MGKTSAKVKSRWDKAHYDAIGIRLPLGSREELKKLAQSRGMSQAQLVRCAILNFCTEEERAELQALTKEPENYKNGYVSAFLGGGVYLPRKTTTRESEKQLYFWSFSGV